VFTTAFICSPTSNMFTIRAESREIRTTSSSAQKPMSIFEVFSLVSGDGAAARKVYIVPNHRTGQDCT